MNEYLSNLVTLHCFQIVRPIQTQKLLIEYNLFDLEKYHQVLDNDI